MLNRCKLFKRIVVILAAYSTIIDAVPIDWVARYPDNDMEDSANWNPQTVPGSSDDAIFNSFIRGIDTNPVENFTAFSISNFNFPHGASSFGFNFNNNSLTFSGTGITGTQTNTSIQVTNANNSSFPGNLISFTGPAGTCGSANMASSNNAALTYSQSNIGIGSINSNFYSSGPFGIENGGTIAASNVGIDSTNGTGNNGIANSASSQLKFDQSFTAENNVAVSVANEGTFSGNNSAQGDAVGIINGSQLISSGAFQTGDNFNCEVHNTGNDSSSGLGLSNIGQINSAQMMLQTTGTVGNNCTITISNTGINSSQTSSFADFIGFINDEQFVTEEIFQAGSNFTLAVDNSGTDTSSGYGRGQVGVINSNSGTTGSQILLGQGGSFGDHATISATNSGSYSGSNTDGGTNAGGMNLSQIVIGDSTAAGSSSFNAGDYFSLRASNSGTDSAQGIGGDAVGLVSSDQAVFYTPCLLGKNAEIILTNTSNHSGHSSSSYVNIGSVAGSQLDFKSSFQVGDNFALRVCNNGTHTGSGLGNNFIGDIINGQQVSFNDGLTIGNDAIITITNSGSNSSSTTVNNQVGSLMGYGKQLLVKGQFQAGDNLAIVISNSGFDASTGAGGNFVGFINNNIVDQTASQMHLDSGGILGNRSSISLSNTGTFQGSNTGGMNAIGVMAGQQFSSKTSFQAGDDFSLTASNTGTSHAQDQSNNSIGQLGSGQVAFGSTCILGNQASLTLSNSGTNNDTAGTGNNIAYIAGSQMLVDGNFIAGQNLNINASNISTNSGDASNLVGYVSGSQISFAQNCTLDDGSMISSFNSGTVQGSQVVFAQGFAITSGKIAIQAVNAGTLGSSGIDVQGSNAGGNADILLGNSSLNIGTTLPTFTISALDGDSTSFVQSSPTLIINTGASTRAEFSGSIQDFTTTASSLVKAGQGTQKLSGTNTYTGLTTIQEGTLIVSGSLAGDILVDTLGILKGAGNIVGTLTNTGTIAPGESIGTITVGSYMNNGGNYAVEVDGLGQGDLIDVLGTGTVNGGTVIVSSADGTFSFRQPYTIVTAGEGVTGTYAGATSTAFIIPELSYDSGHVYLTIQPALANAAESCNQYGVASILDSIGTPNEVQSLLIGAIANSSLKQAQNALESLSGFQYTNDVWMTEISESRLLRRLYDPLRPLVTRGNCPPCGDVACSGWNTWLETGGASTDLHGKNAHGMHADSYQATGGIQKNFCNSLTFGLAGSYEYTHMNYRNGKTNRDTGFLGIYGLYQPSTFYALFDLVYGHSSSSMDRTIHGGHLRYKARSRYNQDSSIFYGETGFDLGGESLLIQPFFGIQIGKIWRGPLREHGANGWGLAIDRHDRASTRSRIGLHLSTSGFCNCLDASLDVAWNQLWSGSKNSTEGRFREFGEAFRICGNRLEKHSVDYAITFSTNLCEGFKAYLEFGGESWPHANTFDMLGGIQYAW